jgi:hypothetical protein
MLSFEQDITRKSEFHVPEDGGVGRREGGWSAELVLLTVAAMLRRRRSSSTAGASISHDSSVR